jgi:hypothetical protein
LFVRLQWRVVAQRSRNAHIVIRRGVGEAVVAGVHTARLSCATDRGETDKKYCRSAIATDTRGANLSSKPNPNASQKRESLKVPVARKGGRPLYEFARVGRANCL